MTEVTQILSQIERGDPSATGRLLPLVYEELRRLAAARLSREPAGQTLQPTALVHEAWLRLVGSPDAEDAGWNSRGHFFGAAAEAMRRILVENARRKHSLKQGGDWNRVELRDGDAVASESRAVDLLMLDEALVRFESEDPQKALLVKLRYFGGLTLEEAAAAIDVSRATADRYWSYARAWLRVALSGEETPHSAKKTK